MLTRTHKLAAIIAALACSGAYAQQAPANTSTSTSTSVQAAGAAAISGAPGSQGSAPSQPGVVYPGRPMLAGPASTGVPASSISGLTPVNTVAPLPGNRYMGAPGAPGTAIAQVPPMPPLPSQPGQANYPQSPQLPMATPSKQYLSDNMPQDLPEAVTEYMRRFDEASRASAHRVNTAAKPVSRTQNITQAPGEELVAARLASGVPTNIVFTDSTGAPWPIEFVTPGDTNVVDALVPVAGSATLQLRPKQPNMYGAVSVNLVGNPTPVTLILASAQTEVDTRIDVRLARRGPNAQAPIIDRPGFTTVDAVMLQVLDGVAPGEAQSIKTSHPDVRAWSHKGRLYIRTTLAVVSPAYTETAASIDGTRVYVMPLVPSVTVSIDGVLRTVRVGE